MSENAALKKIVPTRIAGLLTRSTEQLDSDTVAALRRARNAALARQIAAKPVLALHTGHHFHWPLPHTPPQWIAIVTLLAAVIAGSIGYWHHAQEHETSRLDVAILTDDMPMEVFIDR